VSLLDAIQVYVHTVADMTAITLTRCQQLTGLFGCLGLDTLKLTFHPDHSSGADHYRDEKDFALLRRLVRKERGK
jgi:hypothetical protein